MLNFRNRLVCHFTIKWDLIWKNDQCSVLQSNCSALRRLEKSCASLSQCERHKLHACIRGFLRHGSGYIQHLRRQEGNVSCSFHILFFFISHVFMVHGWNENQTVEPWLHALFSYCTVNDHKYFHNHILRKHMKRCRCFLKNIYIFNFWALCSEILPGKNI